MPIYEFICEKCGKKQSFLLLAGRNGELKCKYCGNLHLKRIISKVKVRLSEETRLEKLADPSRWSDFDESDPKSMAKFMKKLGSEVGEDLGENFDEMVEELEEADVKRDRDSNENEGEI